MAPSFVGSGPNLVLFGPPGAGKGTQAELFCQRHQVPKISTGEILRTAVDEGSGLGLRVKDVLAAGALVDDTLMIELVRDRLERADTVNGFVLDGFPRTVPQARALEAMLAGRGPLVVVALQVSADGLMRRLSGRGRSDDDERIARRRLDVYSRDTAPVLEYFRRRGMIVLLDGDRPPDQVASALDALIRSF